VARPPGRAQSRAAPRWRRAALGCFAPPPPHARTRRPPLFLSPFFFSPSARPQDYDAALALRPASAKALWRKGQALQALKRPEARRSAAPRCFARAAGRRRVPAAGRRGRASAARLALPPRLSPPPPLLTR